MQERLITAQNRLKELNFSLEEKVKKQVQTIQRHEALLTSLFSDMKEGIVLFNEKLEMRFCNPRPFGFSIFLRKKRKTLFGFGQRNASEQG